MSDMSFLTTVKAKSFFHTAITLSPVSLPFLPNLSEMEFLGLSLEGPFEGLDDELLLLLEELVNGLEGELLE